MLGGASPMYMHRPPTSKDSKRNQRWNDANHEPGKNKNRRSEIVTEVRVGPGKEHDQDEHDGSDDDGRCNKR
jgi:hypothetical protein